MRFKPKMSITYNSLNLPSSITYSDGHRVYYTYDAMGNRQRVTYQTAILPAAGILPRAELTIPEEMEGESAPSRGGGGEADGGVENGTRGVTRYRTVLTRDYVDNLVFENGELKYVITPMGFIEDGEYYHQLADYEGNSMVVIDNEGTVYERNNYYPFGLPIVDEHYASAITPYKYGNKEFDTMNGLNAYDFSARRLDPALCQFTTADPLAEHYYPYSPYLYCAGNPILFIDPSGLDIHTFDKWGNYRGSYPFSGADIIIIVKPDGTAMTDKDGRSYYLIMKNGTFSVLKHDKYFGGGNYNYDIYQVVGHSNAKAAFEFFANNITGLKKIEYSVIRQGGVSQYSSINYITTSHEVNTEGGMQRLYRDILGDDYKVGDYTHSHPSDINPSDSDYRVIYKMFYDQKTRLGTSPKFYIYYVPSHQYNNYSTNDTNVNNPFK